MLFTDNSGATLMPSRTSEEVGLKYSKEGALYTGNSVTPRLSITF